MEQDIRVYADAVTKIWWLMRLMGCSWIQHAKEQWGFSSERWLIPETSFSWMLPPHNRVMVGLLNCSASLSWRSPSRSQTCSVTVWMSRCAAETHWIISSCCFTLTLTLRLSCVCPRHVLSQFLTCSCSKYPAEHWWGKPEGNSLEAHCIFLAFSYSCDLWCRMPTQHPLTFLSSTLISHHCRHPCPSLSASAPGSLCLPPKLLLLRGSRTSFHRDGN